MALDALYESANVRIEGSKLEERSDNKLWLVRDLEIARQFILDDLRVVKSLCVPCFPPHYDIFNQYVKFYNTALSIHVSHFILANVYSLLYCILSAGQLEEIIMGGLEGNEYVSLLSWVMNVYPGIELMGHPELKVDISGLPPLIKSDSLQALKNEYLKVSGQP